MKRIFLGLFMTACLLSGCSNDGVQDTVEQKEGSLKAKISFEVANKANLRSTLDNAASTAIPLTTWNNIKQVQLFLYDNNGKVAFSYVVEPSDGKTEFTWTNVPVGTYRLAVVANVNTRTDNVSTSLDGGANKVQFDNFNVRNLLINTQLHIDLKKTDFPTGHIFGNLQEAYSPVSEIFTAYQDVVTISEGIETKINTGLELKREVSLMRVRVDNSALDASQVNFKDASNFIAIERLPKGFGLKTNTFDGGIYDNPNSDPNRIMIAASGLDTYKDADPLTGYNPLVIRGGKFTLWNDIMVLPNTSAKEDKAGSTLSTNRKYFIILSATVKKGYKYADGVTIATEDGQPVYWTGTINEVFAKNQIREVNVTISSVGDPIIPEVPQAVGGLNITVGLPQQWNSQIQVSNIEI